VRKHLNLAASVHALRQIGAPSGAPVAPPSTTISVPETLADPDFAGSKLRSQISSHWYVYRLLLPHRQ
jgi:hypothetical protein